VRQGAGTHFHPDVAEAVLDAAHNGTLKLIPQESLYEDAPAIGAFENPPSLRCAFCALLTPGVRKTSQFDARLDPNVRNSRSSLVGLGQGHAVLGLLAADQAVA
jgi:hypothetical protein